MPLLFLMVVQESSLNVEAVEQMYWRNPILRYTQHPLHSPLLPLPYGEVNVNCESLLYTDHSCVSFFYLLNVFRCRQSLSYC